MTMRLQAYAEAMRLGTPIARPQLFPDEQAYGEALGVVLCALLAGHSDAPPLPAAALKRSELLRITLNVSPEYHLEPSTRELLDRVLWHERLASGIVDADRLPSLKTVAGTRLALWRGDITRLNADAIVNAANAQMQGCFLPLHRCIDNAIHSAAGPGLRQDCAHMMALQEHLEPTGHAKITRAYQLPARFVLHTVGPIVGSRLKPEHAEALASSYRHCLDLAAETGQIRSIAFCCISTGEFGFPPDSAAPLAIAAVRTWLAAHPGALDQVIFNVFTESDYERYSKLLSHVV
jgi:O-acetyl-ADP-ribose deacetylase (regulator of RNase III)